MLHVILLFVQVISALCILVLVMLQRGKGAEAGAGFGAGASGTVFGARGATTALSRATAIFAAVFMINSLVLTYLSTRPQAADENDSGHRRPGSGAGTGAGCDAPAQLDARERAWRRAGIGAGRHARRAAAAEVIRRSTIQDSTLAAIVRDVLKIADVVELVDTLA